MSETKPFEQGQKVKLLSSVRHRKPLSPGQSEPAPGITVVRDGERAFLRFNRVYQVSENTSSAIVNEEISPLPLINADFLNTTKLKSRFKIVDPAKTKDQNNDE